MKTDKIIKEYNVQFQVIFSRNGHLLAATEYIKDKDAVCELVDAINNNRELRDRGIRAAVTTKASGGVDLKNNPINITANAS